MSEQVKTVAVIGGGVIGAGWSARCLARGLTVNVWDPACDAEEKLRASVANAWPAVSKLGLFAGASQDNLTFCATLEEACAQADFIQEAAPERIDLKQSLHAQMDAASRKDVIIASSTSGLLPTEFQAKAANPERIIVGHPFNPVYLLPLVEVLGGEKTEQTFIDKAAVFYETIGMYPLKVRTEIPGFISDRLQEALWREALHMIKDGVATTEEMDAAIAYGPGLRWSIWGTCLIFHLAGGEGGIRHMLKHFDPSLFPWTKLEPPEITTELLDRMDEGCKQQADGRSIKELEQIRDDCLISVMQALKANNIGAGKVLQQDEARRLKSHSVRIWQAGDAIEAPLALYNCRVLSEWVDYNGHMTEAAYLTAFGWATDALFRYIGDDEAYREQGFSYYTVETHINYYQEASSTDALSITTQLLGADDKRMHLFHRMYNSATQKLLATTEQMLLHVDTKAAKACAAQPQIIETIQAIASAHAELPTPKQVGRQMAIK